MTEPTTPATDAGPDASTATPLEAAGTWRKGFQRFLLSRRDYAPFAQLLGGRDALALDPAALRTLHGKGVGYLHWRLNGGLRRAFIGAIDRYARETRGARPPAGADEGAPPIAKDRWVLQFFKRRPLDHGRLLTIRKCAMRPIKDPVKSIRIRYIIGLSALAVLIVSAHLILVRTAAERQEDYGRLIQMAGDQVSLMNRITLFAIEMHQAEVVEEFRVARQQVGRAISLMAKRHEMLVSADPADDLPRVETPLLKTLYHDPSFGLDIATRRFLENARAVYAQDFGTRQDNPASLVYLRTYGPYVLETLLNAAVDEYERFARAEMQRLKRFQEIAVAAALLLLLIEAFYIFRPLERKVREAFEALGDKNGALEEARLAAEHANREKSRFLSNISHELRTPLNAILGFTEALRGGVYGPLASDRQRARLDDVQAAADHLLQLVNDVLELNQLDSGAVVLEESAVDPRYVMRQAASVLQTLAAEHGVDLTLRAPPVPFTLVADERRVLQILLNVIGNAVRYSPSGKAVRVSAGLERDGRAFFRVEDDGPGMTAEERDLALSRFGRSDAARLRYPDGAGLGLPISAELAARHGGALTLESEPGHGVRVTILFPPERVQPSPAELSAIAE
eukprot:g528.t1